MMSGTIFAIISHIVLLGERSGQPHSGKFLSTNCNSRGARICILGAAANKGLGAQLKLTKHGNPKILVASSSPAMEPPAFHQWELSCSNFTLESSAQTK